MIIQQDMRPQCVCKQQIAKDNRSCKTSKVTTDEKAKDVFFLYANDGDD